MFRYNAVSMRRSIVRDLVFVFVQLLLSNPTMIAANKIPVDVVIAVDFYVLPPIPPLDFGAFYPQLGRPGIAVLIDHLGIHIRKEGGWDARIAIFQLRDNDLEISREFTSDPISYGEILDYYQGRAYKKTEYPERQDFDKAVRDVRREAANVKKNRAVAPDLLIWVAPILPNVDRWGWSATYDDPSARAKQLIFNHDIDAVFGIPYQTRDYYGYLEVPTQPGQISDQKFGMDPPNGVSVKTLIQTFLDKCVEEKSTSPCFYNEDHACKVEDIYKRGSGTPQEFQKYCYIGEVAYNCATGGETCKNNCANAPQDQTECSVTCGLGWATKRPKNSGGDKYLEYCPSDQVECAAGLCGGGNEGTRPPKPTWVTTERQTTIEEKENTFPWPEVTEVMLPPPKITTTEPEDTALIKPWMAALIALALALLLALIAAGIVCIVFRQRRRRRQHMVQHGYGGTRGMETGRGGTRTGRTGWWSGSRTRATTATGAVQSQSFVPVLHTGVTRTGTNYRTTAGAGGRYAYTGQTRPPGRRR